MLGSISISVAFYMLQHFYRRAGEKNWQCIYLTQLLLETNHQEYILYSPVFSLSKKSVSHYFKNGHIKFRVIYKLGVTS